MKDRRTKVMYEWPDEAQRDAVTKLGKFHYLVLYHTLLFFLKKKLLIFPFNMFVCCQLSHILDTHWYEESSQKKIADYLKCLHICIFMPFVA